jgi:hypothetical protein
MVQYLGFLDVSVDGTTVASGEDSTLEPGGVARAAVKTNRVVGWRQEVMESKATLNVAIDSGFSLDFYRNLTSCTLTFTADTGQVWTVGGAWCSTPPTVEQKEGKSKIEFTGPPAIEQLTAGAVPAAG